MSIFNAHVFLCFTFFIFYVDIIIIILLPIFCYLSLNTVTHKLSNGVKTKYIDEFESTGKLGLLFPKCADEFQHMINVVLYNPSSFTFHYRMRQALVYMQMHHYPHFDKSESSNLYVHVEITSKHLCTCRCITTLILTRVSPVICMSM